MKIKRLTLDGSVTEVKFEGIKSSEFIVKNYSEDNCYVSFDENLDTNAAVRIAPGFGQIIVANTMMSKESSMYEKIYLKGSGEVEVQAVCYH